MMRVELKDIEPMGAVRMTGRGKYVKPAAIRYLNYKKAIGFMIRNQYKEKPIKKPVEVHVKFIMPIPKSWSQKKKVAAIDEPHVSKPDIDNLVKGVFDAVNGLIWEDDKQVYKTTAEKYYGLKPGIVIAID